jgi:hypothetical protein
VSEDKAGVASGDFVPAWLRAELSECALVEGGMLLADDELVGAVLFLTESGLRGEAPVVPRCVQLERKNFDPYDGPSKLLAVQDIEGLATDGQKRVYCLGSCDAKEGKRRHDREFLLQAEWSCEWEEEEQEFDLDLDVVAERHDVLEWLTPALQQAGVPVKLKKKKVHPEINLEGLALDVHEHRLYIGLRTPLLPDGQAIICSVDAEKVFKKKPERLEVQVHPLALNGGGIRALCWVEGRLLLIAGGTEDEHVMLPEIWAFTPGAGSLELLYRFEKEHLGWEDARPKRYPEGLLVKDDLLVCVFDADDGHGGLVTFPWPLPQQEQP